jgi:putative oxidoreductase
MNALNALFNHPRAGILLLRWTLAILMVFHGWAKVRGGVGGIEGMLVANGLPGLLAYAVGLAHMGHFLDLTASGGWRLELQAFFFVTALVVALTHRIGPNK